VQQRREREEAERRQREEERRRYEEAEHQRLDDNRWRRFTELAARWRQTDEGRRFLAALEQHPDAAASLPNGMPIVDWLSWARGRLSAFDPMADGPAGVFEDTVKRFRIAFEDAVLDWRMADAGKGNREFFLLVVALRKAGLDADGGRIVLHQEADAARSPGERRKQIRSVVKTVWK
jgi:hypothetical protein